MVDKDHKEIFGLVGELLEDKFDSRAERINTAIKFLIDYVSKHFAREERLMDESNYPQAAFHKKEHSDFARVAVELSKKVEGNLENIDLSLEVNNVIVAWLTKHVMGSDKSLAQHYQSWSSGNRT